MNDLNSVLIDGTLTEDPVLTETDEHGTSCRMTLVTTRTTRDGTVHSTTFTVETRDEVARDCSEHLRRDRGVRVVGRLTEENFTIIHSYTRAQAIEDGVLFDITPTAREAGFQVHTAISDQLYLHYIKPSEDARQHGQSTLGRLWDVLMVFHVYAHRSQSQRVLFPVQFVTGTRDNGSPSLETIELLGLLHPGDTGEPVITIMLPEDE